MDYSTPIVRAINISSPQRPLRTAHAKTLLSMQPGDSFVIPKDEGLRSNVLRAARYWRIPIVTRSVGPNEIRIWRVKDKPIEPQPFALTREVPAPVKLTSAADIALLREAKAKSRQRNGRENAIKEFQLVNDDQHTVTLAIAEKKPRV